MVPDAAGTAAWDSYLEGLGGHESGWDDAFYSFNDVDWEGIPLPEDTQPCLPSEPVVPPHAQHQPAKSKQRVKLEKLRARNRLAQARYRQKAKEELKQLESGVCSTTCAVASARARHLELLAARAQLTQQCTSSTAALEAVVTVSRLLPSGSAPVPQASPVGQDTSAAAAATAPLPHVPLSTATRAAVTTIPYQRSSSGVFFGRIGTQVPPPLSSFAFHRAISIYHLEQDASSTFSDSPGLPVFDFNCRHSAGQFQAAEAARCGCGVSDIAWYSYTQIKVTDDCPPEISTSKDEDSGSSDGQRLSFSTTVNSGPCVASFMLMYLHISLNNMLATEVVQNQVVQNQAESVAGDMATDTAWELGAQRFESCEGGYRGVGEQQKRRRGTREGIPFSPPPARPRKPLKSTEEVMAIARVPEVLLDTCRVTCGVGGVAPMKQAVRAVLRSSLWRFCGLVPLDALKQCCEETVRFMDLTLFSQVPGTRHSAVKTAPQQPARGSAKESSPDGSATTPAPGTLPLISQGGSQSQSKPPIKGSLMSRCAARDVFASSSIARDANKGVANSLGATRSGGGATHVPQTGESVATWRTSENSFVWVARKGREASSSALACETQEGGKISGAEENDARGMTQKPPVMISSKGCTHRKPREGFKDVRRATWDKQYKAECQQHMLAIVLVVRAELMKLVDTMSDVVEETPEEEKLGSEEEVMRRKEQLSRDFFFSKLLTALVSPKLTFSLLLESVQQHLGSFFEVDNMHVNLYRQIQPSPRQRTRMAEFWRMWERRKRQLDGDMHAACRLLNSLPTHIPLPHSFRTQLDALTATEDAFKDASEHSASLNAPSATVCDQRRFSDLLQRFCSRARAQKLHQTTWGNSSLHPEDLQLTSSRREGLGGLSSLSLPLSSSSWGSQETSCGQNSRVRFLGQFPEDMTSAERALQELQAIQRVELELYADMVGVQIPGAYLDAEQCVMLWAGHFMSHAPPPDCMELCQIAATQQNRGNLFQEPFPGAVRSGCFRHVLSPDVLGECWRGDDALASGSATLKCSAFPPSAV